VGSGEEEMDEVTTVPSVQYLPLYLLDPPPTPLRTQADQDKFEEMVASIKQFGILQPLGVTPKDDGRYEVVWGHLRYMAAMALKLDSVPCVIRNDQGAQRDLLMLEENAARMEVNPLDEARFYRRLIDQYRLTVSDIASRRGVTAQTIYNKLELLEAPEDVRQALEAGKIPQEAARAIAKLPDPDKRLYYMRQVEHYGASTNIVKTWVQRELIQAGLVAAPTPQTYIEPNRVIRPGGGAVCSLCDTVLAPEQVVGLFLCLEDYRLFQKFKEAYRGDGQQ